jgi:MFS family permease
MEPFMHFTGIAVFSAAAYFSFRSWLLPRDVPTPQDDAGSGKKRGFRPDLSLVLLGAVGFCCMAVEGTMYDWNAVYFASVVQAPPELMRLGYIICMLSMVAGRFLADGLITRFGYALVLRAGGFFMFCGLTLFIVRDGLASSCLASALTGLGMASGVPICFSLAGKSRKVPPSIAISMVVFLSFWGFMLCPPLTGHLSHAFNLRLALLPAAALSLLVFLMTPLLARRFKRT